MTHRDLAGRPAGAGGWFGRRLAATGQGLAFSGLMIVEALAALTVACVITFAVLGVGLAVIPGTLTCVRGLANVTRRLSGRWCGVDISRPYQVLTRDDGRPASWWQRLGGMLTDGATWRDLLWIIVDPLVGWLMTLVPPSLVFWGLFGVVMPAVWKPIADVNGTNWYGFIPVNGWLEAWLCVPLGAATTALGMWAAPWLLGRYGRFAHSLLAPTRQAELEMRASRLKETRSVAIDTRAAELQRIEEALRLGALARLDAMGMTLRSAEQVLAKSPEAASALLAEARRSSAQALAELRDLVRSIHPPVLADRGLGDAVRALAMDSPLRVEVEVDLPGRADPAVESAAYFAVRELLARAARQRGARRASIDLRYARGLLRIDITDDGAASPDAAREPGLQDIERRLAAFDGILAVSSLPGGPAVMSVEVPAPLT